MRPLHLVPLILVSAAASAQNFTLNIAEGMNVAVPEDRRLIPVLVIYNGNDSALKSFKVATLLFGNDLDSVHLNILRTCGGGGKAEVEPASFDLLDTRTAEFCLEVPKLNTDGKYSGGLMIFPGNQQSESAKKFSISRATSPPATLATDRQVTIVEVVRPLYKLLRTVDAPLDTVVLGEKSGKSAARGISIQTDSSLKAPAGFDLRTGLSLKWDGTDWPDPLSTPTAVAPSSAHSIEPSKQVAVGISGNGLRPGEYVIPIHFQAPGASTDNAKFTITVHVRDSVYAAIAALVFALLISFVITKILSGKRRRVALLREIRALRLSQGTTLPPSPAVVSVEAVLHLAERLSSRFWLSGADDIEALVNGVKNTVGILAEARELRAGLQSRLPALMFDRAADEIDRIVSEIGMEPPDDVLLARVKKELDTFRDWLQPAAFPGAVWTVIQPSLQTLKREIDQGGAGENLQRTIQPLRDKLNQALTTAPSDRDAVERAYRNYARLRILWDCRSDNETFQKLTATPEPSLEECFRLTDANAWERLRKSQSGLRPIMPSSSGLEAFEPLPFSVTCADPTVNSSYLFRHRVQYSWQFKLKPGKAKLRERLARKRPSSALLTPLTMGPAVVQYFPNRGIVHAAVTLSYAGSSIDVPAQTALEIGDSSDFGVLQAFEGQEYVAWLIAGAVALATGLSIYYYKNPTFGAPQDYLALLLWGAGMDQGKNFLQALATTDPTGTAQGGR